MEDNSLYYFDKSTLLFYPDTLVKIGFYDEQDLDFTTMIIVDKDTFESIINGDGVRSADENGYPILLPNNDVIDITNE